jgi:hypothetical protein
MAAAHGLRGLDLTTQEGREEALIILSISMATTTSQSSGFANSLAAMNNALTDAVDSLANLRGATSGAMSTNLARSVTQNLVKDAGAILLSTNLSDRQSLVALVESTA